MQALLSAHESWHQNGSPIFVLQISPASSRNEAAQRRLKRAIKLAAEALAKMVMQLGPRGKADGPMAKYPPWDLRRAARLHTPETGKAPPSPDAEDKLPVPPSDLTLRRAAIQKVEIADVGNDARQLHDMGTVKRAYSELCVFVFALRPCSHRCLASSVSSLLAVVSNHSFTR